MGLRSLAIGAVLTAPMAVQGQTAVLRALMDREASAAPPPAELRVLDAPGIRGLMDGFRALLQRPELRAYQVPLLPAVRRGSPGASPADTGWFLVEPRTGTVVAQGRQLPTGEAFAQILERAGFRDRVKELTAYLRRNPDALEAHEQVLALLRSRGEAVAQRDMGLEVPSPGDRLKAGDLPAALAAASDPAPADLSGAKKLDPVQDLEAWSAFAQEWETVFRSGRWREMDFAWIREGRPLDGGSPTLQGLYLRWLPQVEGALREEPASSSLWGLWIWMSNALGGRPLRPLLETLRPSPLTPKGEWPPEAVARELLKAARTPQDWQGLKEHYLALWEDQPHALRDTPDTEELPWERDWDQSLAPLLTCCLRSGATAQADALLREALHASRWNGLPAKAAALASRCGLPALAARWARLRPGADR